MASDLVVIEPILVQKLAHADGVNADGTVDLVVLRAWQKNSHFHHYGDKVLAQALSVGDVIMVEAGQQIACDGVLLSDTATVSQSLLTGESDLIVKNWGDTLIGGSQNDAQPFIMLVTHAAHDSQIALIDRLMNRALSEKPQIAKDADRMARWFVARVLILSVLVFGVWFFIDKSQALWATVAVLVATCPCALSLATPIALTMATNRMAQFGFLATRGHTIQSLSEVDYVAFDKTGTLTVGQANLLDITSQMSKADILKIAGALEVGAKHPIAHAILSAAHGLHLHRATDITHHSAGGVQGVIDGEVYRIGHDGFVAECMPSAFIENLEKHQANISVVLSKHRANGHQVLARLYFNDVMRSDAGTLISQLKQSSITPLMLTGDPSPNALVVAKKLGIEIAHHGLTPADKVAHITRLQEQGKTVLMVGDGINDAPVLAKANVSVAMAGAADLAQVSADAVLLGGKLSPIYQALHISQKTRHIIRQNLRWALIYNTLVLLPAALGYVPPWLAAIGMSLSSLLVVANAMRIRRYR